MSRYQIDHENKSLSFGDDEILGAFIQIWDTTNDKMPDESNMLVEIDETQGLTNKDVCVILAEHGFTQDELKDKYQSSTGSKH